MIELLSKIVITISIGIILLKHFILDSLLSKLGVIIEFNHPFHISLFSIRIIDKISQKISFQLIITNLKLSLLTGFKIRISVEDIKIQSKIKYLNFEIFDNFLGAKENLNKCIVNLNFLKSLFKRISFTNIKKYKIKRY